MRRTTNGFNRVRPLDGITRRRTHRHSSFSQPASGPKEQVTITMEPLQFHAMVLLPLLLLGILVLSSPASATLSALLLLLKNDASSFTSSILHASGAGDLDLASSSAVTSTSVRGLDVDVLFAYMVRKRRGFDSALLITFDLRCDTSQAATFPMPAGMMASYDPATMLQACQSWWTCDSSDQMLQSQKVKETTRKQHKNGTWQMPKVQHIQKPLHVRILRGR